MLIVLVEGIVPDNVLVTLNKLPNGCYVGYSTMHPVKSPIFATCKEVNDWYNKEADTLTKLKFIENGFFVVFVHEISPEECILYPEYKAKKGEILSTDEAAVYDFNEKRWL